MKKVKVILVCGARPNFIKVAPLIRAAKKHIDLIRDFNFVLVHTGQHYDYEMSRVFFKDLELRDPDIYLGVGSGSYAKQTGNIMIRFEKALLKVKPNLVIVVGDVNSTLAAALVAVKVNIPVAHIEAGLRSFDRTMPEEINRILTDAISTYLFTPSSDANNNLMKEGIPVERIFLVGEIIVDNLIFNKPKATQSNILSKLGLKPKGYALLTLHRPSNVDREEVLFRIIQALRKISRQIPIIFSVHPRTKKQIRNFGFGRYFINSCKSFIKTSGIYCMEPLGCLDFLKLEMEAKFVLTDSGGIQAETTILDIPCLTLRDTTERPLTLEEGTNILVGCDTQKIIKETSNILNGKRKICNLPELWDGKSAERIIKILQNYYK